MDPLFHEIAEYVDSHEINSDLAYDTARACLMDSLGCGFLALGYPQCRNLLGPWVPGAPLDRGLPSPRDRFRTRPDQGCL